jgi:hypothetical protein
MALDESGLVQALPERTNKVRGAGRHRSAEKTDHRLLRTRRERPRHRRAADERDELAAPHVGHWSSSAQE